MAIKILTTSLTQRDVDALTALEANLRELGWELCHPAVKTMLLELLVASSGELVREERARKSSEKD